MKDKLLLIKNLCSYIDTAKESLTNEQSKEYFANTLESLKNAQDNVADNEEKIAILLDSANRFANQLTFTLFRENALTDGLANSYRTFPSVEETSEEANKFKLARRDAIAEINAEQAKIMREEKGISIFKAIIGGMSKEDAKAKLEEYEEELAKAEAQAAQNGQ